MTKFSISIRSSVYMLHYLSVVVITVPTVIFCKVGYVRPLLINCKLSNVLVNEKSNGLTHKFPAPNAWQSS